MLKWLTVRAYNRFDPVWIVFAGLALDDHNYLAAIVAAVVGVAVSAMMEVAQDMKDAMPGKLREGKALAKLKRGSNPPASKPKPPPPANPLRRHNT